MNALHSISSGNVTGVARSWPYLVWRFYDMMVTFWW